MKSPRFWIVIVLLTSTIFVLQSRGDVDQVPNSQPPPSFSVAVPPQMESASQAGVRSTVCPLLATCDG